SLTERMQRRVKRELDDADVALLVVNGEQGVGPGDRFIAQNLLAAQRDAERTPVVCGVNKCDRLSRAATAAALVAAAELAGVVEVRAQRWVESESQKGILSGRGGRMIREVGAAARRELERELGAQVFLDLRVRVRERWRRNTSLLDRLGID